MAEASLRLLHHHQHLRLLRLLHHHQLYLLAVARRHYLRLLLRHQLNLGLLEASWLR